jgi:hypothetical protein
MSIKIEDIKNAIEKADQMYSKHGHETYNVPALTSLKIRNLLNNLGALGTKYLECGVHKGGTHTTTIAGNSNLKEIIAIDSFESDLTNDDKAMPQFKKNLEKFLPEGSKHTLIVSDAFGVNVNELPKDIDIYLYDAGHSEADQRKALTYFLPCLADEFIYLCDDFDWPEVKAGTKKGIWDGEFEVLFEHTLVGNDHDNDGYWNGYYIALLRKPKNNE